METETAKNRRFHPAMQPSDKSHENFPWRQDLSFEKNSFKLLMCRIQGINMPDYTATLHPLLSREWTKSLVTHTLGPYKEGFWLKSHNPILQSSMTEIVSLKSLFSWCKGLYFSFWERRSFGRWKEEWALPIKRQEGKTKGRCKGGVRREYRHSEVLAFSKVSNSPVRRKGNILRDTIKPLIFSKNNSRAWIDLWKLRPWLRRWPAPVRHSVHATEGRAVGRFWGWQYAEIYPKLPITNIIICRGSETPPF